MNGPARRLAQCLAPGTGRPHRQRREAAILRHADAMNAPGLGDRHQPGPNDAPSGPLGITSN